MTEPTMPGIADRVADLMTDVAGFGGAVAVTYGAGQIYHPAGFIVGGLFLLAGAWLNARKSA